MKMMGRTTTAKTQRRAASTPSSSSNAVRPLQPAEDTRLIKINYVYRGKTFQKDFQKRFCFTFVFLVILRLYEMGKKQYRGSSIRADLCLNITFDNFCADVKNQVFMYIKL